MELKTNARMFLNGENLTQNSLVENTKTSTKLCVCLCVCGHNILKEDVFVTCLVMHASEFDELCGLW